MVYYWVIGAEGQRYGPADIDTLVCWAHEQRINASTILIDRGTERQITAESLTAVAAAIRRTAIGGEAVAIERDVPAPDEAATATRLPTPDGVPPSPFVHPGQPGGPTVSPGRAIPPVPLIPLGSPYPHQPSPMPYAARVRGPKNKVVAGLLGIFLGGLGIHRFYLGYTGIGLLMLFLSVFGLVASVFSFGCVFGIVGLWGFVEGIICLCGGMRDADGRDLCD